MDVGWQCEHSRCVASVKPNGDPMTSHVRNSPLNLALSSNSASSALGPWTMLAIATALAFVALVVEVELLHAGVLIVVMPA